MPIPAKYLRQRCSGFVYENNKTLTPQIKFERCRGNDDAGISIVGGDLASCVLLVPHKCTRAVFVQYYKYRKELKAEFDAVQYEDRVEAQKIEDELKTVKASIARARERIDDLVVRSTSDGILVVPQAQDLPGRFVHHGEPIAYVVDFKEMTARVVVPQGDVGLVRRDTESVEVRLADEGGDGPVRSQGRHQLALDLLGVQGGVREALQRRLAPVRPHDPISSPPPGADERPAMLQSV